MKQGVLRHIDKSEIHSRYYSAQAHISKTEKTLRITDSPCLLDSVYLQSTVIFVISSEIHLFFLQKPFPKKYLPLPASKSLTLPPPTYGCREAFTHTASPLQYMNSSLVNSLYYDYAAPHTADQVFGNEISTLLASVTVSKTAISKQPP